MIRLINGILFAPEHAFNALRGWLNVRTIRRTYQHGSDEWLGCWAAA